MIGAGRSGRVITAMGDGVTATLPCARVGEGLFIRTSTGVCIPAIVTKVEYGQVRINAHAPLDGVAVGDLVETDPRATLAPLGTGLLGRVVGADGKALDALGAIRGRWAPVIDPPIPAAERQPVSRPFWTGIRTIDGLLTIGRGAASVSSARRARERAR